MPTPLIVPTHPLKLSVVAPVIDDRQRGAVLHAEHDVVDAVRLTPIRLSEMSELLTLGSSSAGAVPLEVRLTGNEGVRSYHRGEGVIEVGGDHWRVPQILHMLAHHITPGIFPAHGIEWVSSFLSLLDTFDPHSALSILAYREAFDRHDVHQTVERRIRRVKKTAVFVAHREPGALIRLVLDDPPEDLICQLLEVEGDHLLVRDERGEVPIEISRCRYIAFKLREGR